MADTPTPGTLHFLTPNLTNLLLTNTPPPATLQSNFEQGVAFALHLWPALTLAVQNNWGGPDSSDKRDWFAGAIVDLFPDLSKPTSTSSSTSTSALQQPAAAEEPDQVDVETVLLQVMLDEFEVNVDDDSAFEVAEQVMRVRGEVLKGGPKFEELEGLRRKFEARKGTKVVGVLTKVEDEDGDTDWDTDDDEEESEEEDEEMGDAPPVKEKEAPEVDEDGFTKVSRKKR
jgi:pre-rRNA-processing protein TSR2